MNHSPLILSALVFFPGTLLRFLLETHRNNLLSSLLKYVLIPKRHEGEWLCTGAALVEMRHDEVH